MKKIWQKDGVKKSNPIVEKYNTGDDYIFDMNIFPYDVIASRAHAKMLKKIGILSDGELALLTGALDDLLVLYDEGKISIRVEDEDCHTVIENYLIEKTGDIGKKIHTGRSRNDQVLVAVRLYMLDEMREAKKLIKELALSFLALAKKNQDMVMPGYTHTQQAMLSSVAHWSLSFTESLINDSSMLDAAIRINNQNPLGTAAGFGVTFELDREMTMKELGFDANIINSMFAQGSRGKFESFAMEGLAQSMMTMARFASDMLFFTTRELNFFKVDESLTTGSSIMPQKKNLDSMELIRGNCSVIFSHQLLIKNIAKGTLSGYNRDLQLIKKPLMESISIVKSSLQVAKEFVDSIEVVEEKIKAGIAKDIVSADEANRMVQEEGISFRDAYVKVGSHLENLKSVDYLENIRSKKSLGSPGNLGLEYYEKALSEL